MSKPDLYFGKLLLPKNEVSRAFYHDTFKRYRNQVVKICRRKQNYFSSYFCQNSKNILKIWQGVRDIISLKPSTFAKPIYISEIYGTATSNLLLVANRFNSFFSSVADTIRSSIPHNVSDFSEYLHNPNLNSIFLTSATSEEASKFIESMYI